MPGKSGLEILKKLKQLRPKLPVLILTMHGEEQFGLRALKAGASGYLTKESATEELIEAIRKVVAGAKHFAPRLTEKLDQQLASKAITCLHETLSDREYQVMLLLSSGKTVSEAAEQMGLSVKTVSTYRARILEKMTLKNNAELTQYALRNRLIE
jgi:DNA-binding NarL/FixJ family response regulator